MSLAETGDVWQYCCFWIRICLIWSGLCAGAEGYSTEEDQELLSRIEKQLKRRFVIGSQVSEHAIVQDFTRQVKTAARDTSTQILYVHFVLAFIKFAGF